VDALAFDAIERGIGVGESTGFAVRHCYWFDYGRRGSWGTRGDKSAGDD
jgi:hypothetical protein